MRLPEPRLPLFPWAVVGGGVVAANLATGSSLDVIEACKLVITLVVDVDSVEFGDSTGCSSLTGVDEAVTLGTRTSLEEVITTGFSLPVSPEGVIVITTGAAVDVTTTSLPVSVTVTITPLYSEPCWWACTLNGAARPRISATIDKESFMSRSVCCSG